MIITRCRWVDIGDSATEFNTTKMLHQIEQKCIPKPPAEIYQNTHCIMSTTTSTLKDTDPLPHTYNLRTETMQPSPVSEIDDLLIIISTDMSHFCAMDFRWRLGSSSAASAAAKITSRIQPNNNIVGVREKPRNCI